MAKTKKTEDTPEVPTNTSAQDLISALVAAINLTKPVEKKNSNNRKPGSPWDPKDGSKKLKLKRKMYQHGIPIDPDFIDNGTIEALNKVKVGRYLGDWVKIFKRKDQGIDIDYPVKTASQRTKLPSMGITEQRDPQTGETLKSGLQILCERCIEEAKNPKPQQFDGDDD